MKISISSLLAYSALCTTLFGAAEPTGGSAVPGGPSTIGLHWQDNSEDEDGFEVERSSDGGTSWLPVGTVDKNITFLYDRGLDEESTHSYRVRSTSTSGPSAWHSLGSATTTIRMNIIFFLADDMGYKDIVGLRDPEIDGPTLHETPALDELISQSTNFTNAYCSGPRCVVARRTILTGKYDWRPEAIPNNDYYVDVAGQPKGGGIYAGGTTVAGSELGAGEAIPDNMTFGEAVKNGNFRTCFIGKYHLGESPGDLSTPVGYAFGDQPPRGPDAQGFDVSIAAGHAGAPPASYFALENLNQGANGAYTFELPNIDDTSFMVNPAPPAAGDYLTDRMTDKAVGFMADTVSRNSDRIANPQNGDSAEPFFLTLAHYAVHTPAEAKNNANSRGGKGYEYYQAKKDAMASDFDNHPGGGDALESDYSVKNRLTQDNPVYAAMMQSYDDSMFELRSYLATTPDPRYPGKMLSETTVIVVSSDHGGKSTTPLDDNKDVEAANGSDTVNPDATYIANQNAYRSGTPNTYSSYPTSNYPYRFGKTWVYEGGLKVPLFVHIPGVTNGSHSDSFFHHADLFATFCDLAGAPQQENEATDSISEVLAVSAPEADVRKESFHFFTNANQGTGNPAIGAYRKDDYKLLYFIVQRRFELYNLAADISERNDLSESRPDLVEEMFHELYQQVIATGTSMPKPGSNSWTSEQTILTTNGVVPVLPDLPDDSPSNLSVTAISDTAVELTWTVNATNATHSVIYRRGPDDSNYTEYDFVPVGQTSFIDQNLQAGEVYRYRVESENLAGWAPSNTGNQTINLSNIPSGLPAYLGLSAVDDTITLVPGELRTFNPLLNDEGEGELVITQVSSPTSGTASTDGKFISYQAEVGFDGSVSMTYTVEQRINGTAVGTSTGNINLVLPIVDTTNNEVEFWDFNDQAGIQLEATSSTSGTQFTGTTSPKVATDGSGSLFLQQDTTDHFRTTDQIAGGPYNSGKFVLEYRIASLDLTNSSNGANFGFSLRDDTTSTDFGNVRVRRTGSDIVLEIRTSSNNQLYSFGNNTISDVVIKATLDLDNQVWTSVLSIAGGPEITLPDVPSDTGAIELNSLRFQGNQDSSRWAAADFAKIDYLSVDQVASETSIFDSWSTTFPWHGIIEKGAGEDPDKDGIVNLLEFAFGTSPTSPNVFPINIVTLADGSSKVLLTPLRSTSSLSYQIQFSNDLALWDQFPAVSIDTPAGQAVEAPLPAGDKVFSRVRVTQGSLSD